MTPGKNKSATIFFFSRDAVGRDVCMIFSEQIYVINEFEFENLNLRIENENAQTHGYILMGLKLRRLLNYILTYLHTYQHP